MREMRSLMPSAVVGGTDSRSTSLRTIVDLSPRVLELLGEIPRLRRRGVAVGRRHTEFRVEALEVLRTSSRSYPLRTIAKGSGAARRSESLAMGSNLPVSMEGLG